MLGEDRRLWRALPSGDAWAGARRPHSRVKRVLVIGSGGAGKSTFARRLGAVTGLPVVHLDAHYWQAGWVATPDPDWRATVAELIAGEEWILDGNYGGTLDARLESCDTVVFLDVPRLVCLFRVVKRWLGLRGRARPDVGRGCPERLTWEFVRWVWDYPARRRPDVLARLARLSAPRRAFVLGGGRDVDAFIEMLTGRPGHGRSRVE